MGSSRAVRSKLSTPVRRLSHARKPVCGLRESSSSLRSVECIPESPDLIHDFFIRDELPEILETHQKLAILSSCFKGIHSATSGPAHAASVGRKDGSVAGADEFVLAADPGEGAPQVRAYGGKNTELPVTVFRHVHSLF